jgi:hypothetical protein
MLERMPFMFARISLLLTAGLLGGCSIGRFHIAGGPVDPQAGTSIDHNLARLAALDVFKVGHLVVEPSDSATTCAGPCDGAAAAVNSATTYAATRLAQLAERAERAVTTPVPDACGPKVIEANLAALASLRIVRVSGLVVTKPANNPECGGRPCPDDEATAAAATCLRAGKLAAITAAAKGL